MGQEMKINNVRINFVKPRAGLIAFASIVIDDRIRMNGIAIHEKSDCTGYRITYPTRKTGLKDSYLFHPVCPETSALIEKAVFIELKTVLETCHDRHHNAHAQSE